MCVVCLGKEHVHSVLEGTECADCKSFLMKKLFAHVPFSNELRQASVPGGSGPAATEAQWSRTWGSQVELAEDFEQGMSLSQSSLDEDILLLESSDPTDSALLATSQKEQDVAAEGEDVVMEPSEPACPAYNELLEVMACTTQRLDLSWKRKKPQIACGRFSWPTITAQF